MAEYIKKDTIEKFIKDGLNNPDKNKAFGHDAIEILDEIHFTPAADVEEVKHGRWVKDPHTADVCAEYRCSLCDYSYCEADPKHPPFKYCPECGAKNE